MNEEALSLLTKTVQHNCHIADARHAGDYTLCVYLLKMREMYRWEQGQGFNKTLTTDDVGDWLTKREEQWDVVEESDYQPLVIDGKSYFGTMSAMGKKLSPALYAAYEQWHKTDDLEQLHTLIETHKTHWQQTAQQALAIFQEGSKQAAQDIEALIESGIKVPHTIVNPTFN